MNREASFDEYLAATAIIDCDHPKVRAYAQQVAEAGRDAVEQSVQLYSAVRDGIRYDPYAPFYLPDHYRASYVLERGKSFCIPKAALLCALGRACKIPSRIGFATVKNHLATRQLMDYLGSNIFVYHGFVEFYLRGKWVKATPAFNRELCERHNVAPLEFNGHEDSLFHPYNSADQKYMEYLEYQGTYADVPVAEILEAWERTYGKERLQSWIDMHKTRRARDLPDFATEEVLSD